MERRGTVQQPDRDQHRRAMNPFRPPAWLANRHLQSILPSFPLHRPAVEWRARAVIRASKPIVLECGDGARLMGWHAEPPPAAAANPPRMAVPPHARECREDSLHMLPRETTLQYCGI